MSMRNLLLSAAAALLLAAPAFADGGPVPEPVPPAPPPEPAPEYEPAPEPAPAPPAEEWQYYIEGFGGIAFADELDYGGGPFEMETGWNAGGALGAHISPHWDMEIEVFHAEVSYEDFEDSISGLSIMLDLIYNFNTDWIVDPYAGGGFGVTRVRYDGGETFAAFTGEEWEFGYQFMGGLMFHLGNGLDAFAEYRFHDVAGDAAIEGAVVEYRTHNVSGGLRMNF